MNRFSKRKKHSGVIWFFNGKKPLSHSHYIISYIQLIGFVSFLHRYARDVSLNYKRLKPHFQKKKELISDVARGTHHIYPSHGSKTIILLRDVLRFFYINAAFPKKACRRMQWCVENPVLASGPPWCILYHSAASIDVAAAAAPVPIPFREACTLGMWLIFEYSNSK